MYVRLRWVLHPALMPPVLGRVDRRDVRQAEPLGERLRRGRDEPVVAMDEVVAVLLRERFSRGEHVVVHTLHPRNEAVEVSWPARLPHAMYVDAGELAAGILAVQADATGEHVDTRALAHERLGELAHMASEPPLDHWGVLPREEQHSSTHA